MQIKLTGIIEDNYFFTIFDIWKFLNFYYINFYINLLLGDRA
jgi:hypothetical protein